MSDTYIITFADNTKSSFVIKPYTSNGPFVPGQSTPTPLHPQATASNTPLVLLGKGLPEYGEEIATNFVRLLEHFANDDPPAYAIEGQLWYKNDTQQLYFCVDPNAAVFGDKWKEIFVNGIVGSNMDANNNRIINLANPTNPQDAVTLSFAEDTYVNVGGDTMTGPLSLATGTAAAPSLTFASDNAKGLYDNGINDVGISVAGARVASFLSTGIESVDGFIVSTLGPALWPSADSTTSIAFPAPGETHVVVGGLSLAEFGPGVNITLKAPVDMSTLTITNIGTPTNSSDAATKQYVDDAIAVGGADGVVTSGNIDTSTGVLTLARSIGGDVVIPNFELIEHTQSANTIEVITNPIGNITESRMREVFVDTVGYPTSTSAQVLGVFDRDIFNLKLQNLRHIIDLAQINIVNVNNTLDTFSVTGNLTSMFKADVLFEVVNSTGNNGTYTCLSSRYLSGPDQTEIYVAEDVTDPTVDGSIERYTYILPFAYRVEQAKLLVSEETAKYYASKRGSAEVRIQPPFPAEPIINIASDTTLTVAGSPYDFDIEIDGAPAATISITVPTEPYTYNSLINDINSQMPSAVSGYQDILFSIPKNSGDPTTLANDATVYSAIVVVDNVGYMVDVTGSAAQNFTDLLTEINADLTGAVATLFNGDIRISSVSTGMLSSVRIQDLGLFAALDDFLYIDKSMTGKANAFCVFESVPNVYNEVVPMIKFYSSTANSSSEIVITDNTLFSNLPYAAITNNPIGTDYEYEEVPIAFTTTGSILSDRVTFSNLPTNGNRLEFIVTV